MMQFMRNLDNKLGKMIDQMDGALNAPVNQCLTGEVFRAGDNAYLPIIRVPQGEVEVDVTCDAEINVDADIRSTQTTKLVKSTTRA